MPDERGHLKVFIGMAPGVGKTYRMLQEGRAEADSGRDVAIGYLEPHGRQETVEQAARNHLFTTCSPPAVGETALPRAAGDVEARRRLRETEPIVRRDEEGLPAAATAAPQAIGERLLALATLKRESEHVVRRAWRSA